MQENSPYAAPEADITTQNSDETYQPQFFATKGRIGRLRYLAYLFGMSAVVMVIMVVLPLAGMAFAGDYPSATVIIVTVILPYVALLVFVIILAKRRLNDLDKTGWLALVLLIPFVGMVLGLYMLFASGTDGTNKYGLKPCENSAGVKILVLAIPIVLGVLVAIAVPAYQEYTARAAAAAASL